MPQVAASEPGRACVKTSTALVSVFPKFFVLDLGTGTSPPPDYVKSEKLDSVWVVITVDKDPKRKPSVCENIFRWPHWLASLERHTRHEHSSFTGWDWIHFSPDCREFSSSKIIGDRDIDGGAVARARRPRVDRESPPASVGRSSRAPTDRARSRAQPCMRELDDVMLLHAIHFCQSLGLGIGSQEVVDEYAIRIRRAVAFFDVYERDAVLFLRHFWKTSVDVAGRQIRHGGTGNYT